MHISDVHGDSAALNRMYDRCQTYDSIDEYICTGDMVPNTSASVPITDWWIPQILTVIGNHDTATISEGVYDWTAVSMADRDSYYIAPFESNWGITHTPGTSYYYKDYTSNNLRLIVLDTMLYASGDTATEAATQTQWFENLLDSAITNGYHVLVATHSGRGDNVECSFSSYESATTPAYALPIELHEMIDTKITGGLHFVGLLCGHAHQDNIFVYTGLHKQYSYSITCANVALAAQWAYSDQHRSTTEDAWNIVIVDTTNSLVKIIRDGGANIDRYLRPRNTITINYDTGDIIQSD